MKKFKKSENPQGWPFADGDVVEVHLNMGAIIAVIEGVAYAMNGWAVMTRGLPEVRIIQGRSVGPYIKEALR